MMVFSLHHLEYVHQRRWNQNATAYIELSVKQPLKTHYIKLILSKTTSNVEQPFGQHYCTAFKTLMDYKSMLAILLTRHYWHVSLFCSHPVASCF